MKECKNCSQPVEDGKELCENCSEKEEKTEEGLDKTKEKFSEKEKKKSTNKESKIEDIDTEKVDVKAEIKAETKVETKATAEEVTTTNTTVDQTSPAPRNKIKPVFFAVAVLIIALIAFVGIRQFGSLGKPKFVLAEKPIIYINGEEKLSIYKNGMETSQPLGNQGFSKTTQMRPVATSKDNQKIAFLTELNALFIVPVEKSISGDIDPEYLVVEKAKEVLGFAPDNHNQLYYIDENGYLAFYNGKKTQVISDKLFTDEQGIGINIFSTGNDGRILYYEMSEDNLTLVTQIAGKSSSIIKVPEAISNGISKAEDDGIYYYARKADNPDPEAMELNFLDFKSKKSLYMGDTQQLYGVMSVGDKGKSIVIETVPIVTAPETDVETPVGEVTPQSSEMPEYKIGLLSAEVAPEQEQEVAPDAAEETPQVTEIEIDPEGAVADPNAQQVELTEEEMQELMNSAGMGQEQAPPVSYSIYFHDGKEKKLIAENVSSAIYPNTNGKYIIYGVVGEDGNASIYYKNLKNGLDEEQELLLTPPTPFIEIAQLPNDTSFAIGSMAEGGENAEVTVFTLDDKGKIASKAPAGEEVFSLLPNTLDDGFIVKQNVDMIELGEEAYYTADIFFYKNGEYTLVDSGVDNGSVGTTIGSTLEDNYVVYLDDIKLNPEGAVVGTLKIFEEGKSSVIAENFQSFGQGSPLAVLYESKDTIYYFMPSATDPSAMELHMYDGSGTNKIIDSAVFGLM